MAAWSGSKESAVNPKTVRLATVLATGRRYLVNSIDFRADRVLLWGEVTAHRNAGTTHEPAFWLDLSAVSIAEVPKTIELARELFLQGCQALRDSGHTVALSGRKTLTATVTRR